MITGDAEDTAVAIASDIGFFNPSQHRTLSGTEIEHMTVAELEVRLDRDLLQFELLHYIADDSSFHFTVYCILIRVL